MVNIKAIFSAKKPNHIWSRLNKEEFLIKIGAARKSRFDGRVHPTLGGLLFFGDFNTITDELPNYFLDYREQMSNETRWSDRVCSGDGDWSGNIFDFYYRIIDKLTSDAKRPFGLDKDLTRIDDTPVHASIRECLANALIHADYYGLRGIVITKSFREITFSNPGTFRIGKEDAIAGGISDARNGKIFNMFALINIGERSGMGLCNVYHVWEEYDFKKPILIETVDPDRISLTLQMVPKRIESNETNNEANNEVDDVNSEVKNNTYRIKDSNYNTNLLIRETSSYGIDEALKADRFKGKELSVLRYLKAHPEATIKETAASLNISRATVDRAIKNLKDKDLLSRAGSRRKTRWLFPN